MVGLVELLVDLGVDVFGRAEELVELDVPGTCVYDRALMAVGAHLKENTDFFLVHQAVLIHNRLVGLLSLVNL